MSHQPARTMPMIPSNLPEKSRRLRRIQLVMVSVLLLAGIINYLDRGALSIANIKIMHDLNLDPGSMGLLLSVFSLSYAFSQLPAGVLLDRFGSRRVVGIGMFFWSIAQASVLFVTGLGQFVVARVFLGMGESPGYPGGTKAIAEWFPTSKRGAPVGIFQSSSALGLMITPPLLTGLMLAFGWRWMFAIMGILGALVSIVWVLVYRDRQEVRLDQDEEAYLSDLEAGEATRENSSREKAWKNWARLFRFPATWGLILGFVGTVYMVWLYIAWLPFYLEKARHISIARTGFIAAIPFAFGALGMIASGYISDFLKKRGLGDIASRKWPICVGLLGSAVATLPVAFTPNLTLAVIYISTALFCSYMASGSCWSLVSVIVEPNMVGSLGSLQNFGGFLGGSLAPFLTGLVVSRTGSFSGALVIAACVAFLAAFVYVFLVRRKIVLQY